MLNQEKWCWRVPTLTEPGSGCRRIGFQSHQAWRHTNKTPSRVNPGALRAIQLPGLCSMV
jgi:hypothetical protein